MKLLLMKGEEEVVTLDNKDDLRFFVTGKQLELFEKKLSPKLCYWRKDRPIICIEATLDIKSNEIIQSTWSSID